MPNDSTINAYKNFGLPLMAVIEAIATKGASPGTAAMNQQQIFAQSDAQRRADAKAEMDRLDKEAMSKRLEEETGWKREDRSDKVAQKERNAAMIREMAALDPNDKMGAKVLYKKYYPEKFLENEAGADKMSLIDQLLLKDKIGFAGEQKKEGAKREAEISESKGRLKTNPLIAGFADEKRKYADTEINKINDAASGYQRLMNSVDALADFKKQYGTVPLTGKLGTKYNNLRTNLLLNMKTTEKLGVLSESDRVLLDAMLPQAGFTGVISNAVNLTDFDGAIEQIRNNSTNAFKSEVEILGIKTKVFDTPEEAEGAGLPKGTRVYVGGRKAIIE